MKKICSAFLILIATAFAADRAALIEEIKQAERDFSTMSHRDGSAVAFPAFMAEPSIFSGQVMPTRAIARERLPNRPRRPGVGGGWEPIEADVSASGDFGYAWGHFRVTGLTTPEGQPRPVESITFTVWRKQADGSWKFVLDFGGAPSTEAIPFIAAILKSAAEHPAPDFSTPAAEPVDREHLRRDLRALDRSFEQRGRNAAMLDYAAENILSIDLLVRGKTALADRLAQEPAAVSHSREPLYSDVSSSGDLGYSLGFWKGRHVDGKGVTVEDGGVYASFWKRQPGGPWQLLLDHVYTVTSGPIAEKLPAFKEDVAKLP